MLHFINNFLVFYYISLTDLKFSLIKEEYFSLLVIILIASLLSFIILILSYFLVIQKPESEKLSTYECGFEPYEDARLQFDVKFYLIAILFFSVLALFIGYNVGHKEGLNKGQAPYSRMKAECEQELPRDEYCVLTAVRSE